MKSALKTICFLFKISALNLSGANYSKLSIKIAFDFNKNFIFAHTKLKIDGNF